jgi:hypothetical protein
MLPEDFRGLTPLFYGHITPYAEFQLDMNKGINIEETNLKHQMAPECSSAGTTPDCDTWHSNNHNSDSLLFGNP